MTGRRGHHHNKETGLALSNLPHPTLSPINIHLCTNTHPTLDAPKRGEAPRPRKLCLLSFTIYLLTRGAAGVNLSPR